MDTNALPQQDANEDCDMDTYTVADAIRDASTQLDTIGDGHRTRLGYWHTDSQFHWHYHTNTDAVHRHGNTNPTPSDSSGYWRSWFKIGDYLPIGLGLLMGIPLGVAIGLFISGLWGEK